MLQADGGFATAEIPGVMGRHPAVDLQAAGSVSMSSETGGVRSERSIGATGDVRIQAGTGLLDDGNHLMAHRAALIRGRHVVVAMQI